MSNFFNKAHSKLKFELTQHDLLDIFFDGNGMYMLYYLFF